MDYDKHSCVIKLLIQASLVSALLMINIVVQCIGIKFLMISIILQCIGIKLLMISIVV